MGYMLGSECSPCCKPCPHLDAECLEVTFSGFDSAGGNCNECEFLNATKFILQRQVGNGCVFFGSVCATCPGNAGKQVVAQFTAGASSHELKVVLRQYLNAYTGDTRFFDSEIAVAAKSHDGSEWAGPGFVFAPGDFAEEPSCFVSGTATVKKTSCSTEPDAYCDLPEQITLTISGIQPTLAWVSRNGGSPSSPGACQDGSGGGGWGNVFCGQCEPQDGIRIRFVGFASGPAGYTVYELVRNDTAILDREDVGCGVIRYTGSLPMLPSGGAIAPTNIVGTNKCGYVEDPDSERREPTLEAKVYSANGTDASLTVTVGAGPAYLGEPTWAVSSVSLSSAGTKYTGNEQVFIYPTSLETTVVSPAEAKIVIGREAPTFSTYGGGGSGAQFSVSLSQFEDSDKTQVWKVSSITADPKGTGYTVGQNIFLTPTAGVEIQAASAVVSKTGRAAPTLAWGLAGPLDGQSGGAIDVTVSGGGESWSAGGMVVMEPGSGWEVGDLLEIVAVPPDITVTKGSASVTAVDKGGGLVSVSVTAGGQFYKDLGSIEEINVTNSGKYYKLNGKIEKVEVVDGGSYYDTDLIPELSRSVAVEITPAGLETTVSIDGPTNEGTTAAAEVTAITSGAITAIFITEPGSGYAREIFTRVEPTITAESKSTSGTDAVFSVTLSEQKTAQNFKWVYHWEVDSVSVTSGGTGYAGTEPLAFSVAEGDTEVYAASGSIVTGREEPTLSASVSTGSGASLDVVLTKGTDYNGLDVWSVSGVTVAAGGTGYTDGESVTLAVDDGIEVYPASATTKVGRDEPDVSVTASSSGGSGAVLSAVLAQSGDSWYVSEVTIDDGGSGYSQYDGVNFSPSGSDVTEFSAYGYVSEVDGSGAITAVSVTSGGSYYKPDGIIASVVVAPYGGGEYYKSTGVVESVLISWGGNYYRSEPSGAVAVDNPNVSIGSRIGTGAEAVAVVDADPESPLFGQVTAIQIVSGGSGYHLGGTGWKASVGAPALVHRAGECIVSPVQFGTPCNVSPYSARGAPTLVATIEPTVAGGEPATLSIELTASENTQPSETVYSVDKIVVDTPGSGYIGTERVVFSVNAKAGDVVVSQAAAIVTFGRSEPSVEATASSGSGASFTVNLTKSTDGAGLDVWGVSSVSVDQPGADYIANEPLVFSVAEGVFAGHAKAHISSVDNNGGVQSISVTESGTYFSGTVAGVEVADGGAYYNAPKLCSGYDALPMDERVTADPCPTALLGREYTMAIVANIFPDGVSNPGKANYCLSGPFNNFVTIVGFDGQPITCTLSTA